MFKNNKNLFYNILKTFCSNKIYYENFTLIQYLVNNTINKINSITTLEKKKKNYIFRYKYSSIYQIYFICKFFIYIYNTRK